MINPLITWIVLIQTFILSIQSIITLTWMIYAWENPKNIKKHKSPSKYKEPFLSFTSIIPARHEEKVIKETIASINQINYPRNLQEIIVVNTADDTKTIKAVKEVVQDLNIKNLIHIILPIGSPLKKPHNLNKALEVAKSDIITIFDAEDEPHEAIYNIVNTVMIRDDVDVVQSGIQLMNYNSHWFSTLNVLEYFFWFKSGLHFFTDVGSVSPLGGNTVFFKKNWLEFVNGWDENNLTEDADIGIRLTTAGAKTKVIYDENHVTKEETPDTTASFIKQRTRWNQGFLQIFLKGDWLKLPTFKQKITALYILTAPFAPTFLILYLPINIWIVISRKLPILLSLFSFVPLFLLLLIVSVILVGLYEFTKAYNLKFGILTPIRVLVSFFPYVFVLNYSFVRAIIRLITKNSNWEKTLHLGAHRYTKKSFTPVQNVR